MSGNCSGNALFCRLTCINHFLAIRVSKLPSRDQFWDVSDYGRSSAVRLVAKLKHTSVTAIHLTIAFFVVGLLSVYLLYKGYYFMAALCLILKNILDAADGEMARMQNHPSHTGRYLDSVCDFLINLGIFYVLFLITDVSFGVFLIAFLGLELQGSIFNYYYLIQRKICGGDTTSRVDEGKRPVPYPYENGQLVSLLHALYNLMYGAFDKLMILLDRQAIAGSKFPNWFMSIVSSMGLGFQLLIMALLLSFGLYTWILPFFIGYTIWGFAIILIRKVFV